MKKFCALLFLFIFYHCSAQLPDVGSGVYHLDELPVKKEPGRESRKMLEGTTKEFSFFKLHVTTQEKGAPSKPAHTQKDIEELIIIKEGTLTCKIGGEEAVLGPQSVLLIPPGVSQEFKNTGDGPVTYYVLQFRSRKNMDMERSKTAGGNLVINADTLAGVESKDKVSIKYFDRPTAMCERYEMHITALQKKGPSHAPHQHMETEIILVIDGTVGMMIDGKEYSGRNGDLFIAESGSLHGVSNAGNGPCSYFAFKWR